MRIRATISFATKSSSYQTGETYEVAAAIGKQWIANGWAEEVKPPRAKKPQSKKVI